MRSRSPSTSPTSSRPTRPVATAIASSAIVSASVCVRLGQCARDARDSPLGARRSTVLLAPRRIRIPRLRPRIALPRWQRARSAPQGCRGSAPPALGQRRVGEAVVAHRPSSLFGHLFRGRPGRRPSRSPMRWLPWPDRITPSPRRWSSAGRACHRTRAAWRASTMACWAASTSERRLGRHELEVLAQRLGSAGTKSRRRRCREDSRQPSEVPLRGPSVEDFAKQALKRAVVESPEILEGEHCLANPRPRTSSRPLGLYRDRKGVSLLSSGGIALSNDAAKSAPLNSDVPSLSPLPPESARDRAMDSDAVARTPSGTSSSPATRVRRSDCSSSSKNESTVDARFRWQTGQHKGCNLRMLGSE